MKIVDDSIFSFTFNNREVLMNYLIQILAKCSEMSDFSSIMAPNMLL